MEMILRNGEPKIVLNVQRFKALLAEAGHHPTTLKQAYTCARALRAAGYIVKREVIYASLGLKTPEAGHNAIEHALRP